MGSDTNLIATLLSLLPFLAIVGVMIFLIARMRTSQKNTTNFQREYIEEMRKQTQIQERIASALEKYGTHG